MVLLARVLPPAEALPQAAVQGPVPGSALAQAQEPVRLPVLGLASPLHQRLGGAPPSPVAALAPLPEKAQEEVS